MVVARTETLVQLNDALLAALDQRAANRGVSRSRLIREAVEAHLASDQDSEISRQIMEGYDRIPQATLDAWGEPVAFTSRAAADLHRRLEAEEQAAGHEPW